MNVLELLESGMIEGNAHLLPNVAYYAIRAENFDQALAALKKPCVWAYDEQAEWWVTSCNNFKTFEGCSSIEENGYIACPFCMRRIEEGK